MAFNNYIQINDGTNTYKYKTALRSWKKSGLSPSTARILLSGSLDVTYGQGDYDLYDGEILTPVTSPGAGWGTIDTLRVQLKRKVIFQFTDHYGTLHSSCAIQGTFDEDSIMPDWDVAGNDIFVKIRVMAV
ncbi:MAG: hypothetical protein ACWGQW_08280 [bacterium]